MTEKRLGRGLDFLISEEARFQGDEILELDIESTVPNRLQPRHEFDSETLRDLASSIEAHGVLQPIVVRPFQEGYEIIAGERRWRACKMLGRDTIPAVIRDVDEEELLELALVENLHRSDLNAIEKATACKKLIDGFKLNHEAAARKLGQRRSTLTNLLRLLDLPEELRDLVANGALSAGHAKAILGLESTEAQLALGRRIAREGVSVREVEAMVSQGAGRTKREKPRRAKSKKPAHVLDLEDRLRKELGTRVAIQERGKGGRIVIEFTSKEDFERILAKIERGG